MNVYSFHTVTLDGENEYGSTEYIVAKNIKEAGQVAIDAINGDYAADENWPRPITKKETKNSIVGSLKLPDDSTLSYSVAECRKITAYSKQGLVDIKLTL